MPWTNAFCFWYAQTFAQYQSWYPLGVLDYWYISIESTRQNPCWLPIREVVYDLSRIPSCYRVIIEQSEWRNNHPSGRHALRSKSSECAWIYQLTCRIGSPFEWLTRWLEARRPAQSSGQAATCKLPQKWYSSWMGSRRFWLRVWRNFGWKLEGGSLLCCCSGHPASNWCWESVEILDRSWCDGSDRWAPPLEKSWYSWW